MSRFSTLLSMKGKEWLHEVFCGKVQSYKYFEREYEVSLGLAVVKSKARISLFIQIRIIIVRDEYHFFDKGIRRSCWNSVLSFKTVW